MHILSFMRELGDTYDPIYFDTHLLTRVTTLDVVEKNVLYIPF